MSLVKIPCIIIAILGLQITVTPPHPPPSPGEKAASTSLEVVMKQRTAPIAVKAVCWAAAIAEIAVIIASHTRHYQISQHILTALVINGSADRIRITPLFVLGTLMAASGGLIRHRCYRELGKLFTFEMSIRKDHRLVTCGPYSVVRHPGYTGVLLTVVGMIFWHATQGSWARECGALSTKMGQVAAGVYLTVVTVVTTGLLTRMSKEDEALKKEFSQDWVEWAQRVPYKLVPCLY